MQSGSDYLMHALNSFGEELSQHEANVYIENFLDYSVIGKRDALLMRSALSDNALSAVDPAERARVRMDVFKNMLTCLFLNK